MGLFILSVQDIFWRQAGDFFWNAAAKPNASDDREDSFTRSREPNPDRHNGVRAGPLSRPGHLKRH